MILLSFTLASNSHHQSLTFVQKPNLFNVAITRAKKQLICFISKPVESVQPGLLRSYLEYIRSMDPNFTAPVFADDEEYAEKPQFSTEKYNDHVEEELAGLCKEQGLTVIPGFYSAGVTIDLVVSNGSEVLAVELCGFSGDENHEKEIAKQELLQRCGWNVIRITAGVSEHPPMSLCRGRSSMCRCIPTTPGRWAMR